MSGYEWTTGETITAQKLNATGDLTGSIQMLAYAPGTIPSGYLYCDGSPVSRSTYAALFAAIGTIYGVGDNSTTFNLPDFRGVFLRGLDDGKGYDSGRAMGTYQADDNKAHTHTVTAMFEGVSGSRAAPGGTQTQNNLLTTSSSGTEGRPKNFPVYYLIKT